MPRSILLGDIFEDLRNTINKSVKLRNEIYQKKDGSWDRLWAALDALEDAQEAVESYKSLKTVGYLELYGLLQAFVVQQDSIDLIRQTVLGSKPIKWKSDNQKLYNNRRLRNETVGHPGNIKTSAGTKYCNIDRSSINKNGFEYILWSSSGGERKTVDTNSILSDQDDEISKIAQDIIQAISKNDKNFIKQFKNKKVKDKYNEAAYYLFEKLFTYDKNPILAKTNFSQLKKIYSEIKEMLEERYGDFGSSINVPGLKLNIEELDELFKRVELKLDAGVNDGFDFTVYIDNLHTKWQELGEMVDETDKKFAL